MSSEFSDRADGRTDGSFLVVAATGAVDGVARDCPVTIIKLRIRTQFLASRAEETRVRRRETCFACAVRRQYRKCARTGARPSIDEASIALKASLPAKSNVNAAIILTNRPAVDSNRTLRRFF